MSKRRDRREQAKLKYGGVSSTQPSSDGYPPIPPLSGSSSQSVTGTSSSAFVNYYTRTYKKWLILPMVLLIVAMLQIGYQVATTGSFLHKGVELKGGLSITLTEFDVTQFDVKAVEQHLRNEFPNYDIQVRLQQGGLPILTIKADITDEQAINKFKLVVVDAVHVSQDTIGKNLEITGSTIGDNFFRQTFIALIVAFLFMAVVVLLYLRNFAPALAIILAAFSDMVTTLAILNVMGVKLSTAGIVAFLFLIGYSVDTDMLLSARVLRRKEGTPMERSVDAMKTGLTMTFATLAAVLISLVFTSSEVISQIMIVLLIGLLVDIINTWIQNVGILMLYLEKKHGKI